MIKKQARMKSAMMRRAQKTRSILDIPTRNAQGVRPQLPLLCVRGSKPGPLTVVIAGQHGRELNGIAAIAEAFETLRAEEVRGDAIFLPVMNPLAVRIHQQDYPFEDARFRSPVSGSWNMDQTWGRNDTYRNTYAGGITEYVWRKFVRHADLLLDLHGWQSLSLAWALHRDLKHLLAFGLPWNLVINKSPASVSSKGSLENKACCAGIPNVVVELAPQNVLSRESVKYGRRGILNLLRHTGALRGKPDLPPEQHIFNENHKEIPIYSPCEGLVRCDVRPGQIVRRGERVLRVLSLDTLEPVHEALAPCKALVFFTGGSSWGEDQLLSDVVYPTQMVALLKVINRTLRNLSR